MRILLRNPNITGALTDLLLSAGKAAAAPGTALVPMTTPRGVPYIASRAEAQIGGAVALDMLAECHRDHDAAIIAAFGAISDVQSEKEDLLIDLASRAVTEDGADVVILAGAPLAGLAAKVRDRIAVPVVFPIRTEVLRPSAV